MKLINIGLKILNTMTNEEIQKRCKKTINKKLKEDKEEFDLSFLDD